MPRERMPAGRGPWAIFIAIAAAAGPSLAEGGAALQEAAKHVGEYGHGLADTDKAGARGVAGQSIVRGARELAAAGKFVVLQGQGLESGQINLCE